MSGAGEPSVSVVVATRDRARLLERLLDAIAAQRIDEPFELIVVDDASRDATAELLRERARSGGLSLRVVTRDTPGGPAGARNSGWRAARAPLVAFTDDDCAPEPGWLAALSGARVRAPGAVLQGPTTPDPRDEAQRGPFARTLDVRSLGPWFPMSNMAYPRELLERLGGFDEAFPRGEDTDLAWRAIESGTGIVWVEDARVRHAILDIGPLGRLRVAWAWAPAVANFARHPALRRELWLGAFWKREHAELLLALAGTLLARRAPPALLLALPYARRLRARMRAEGAPLRLAPYYALHDAVETTAAARGSATARTLAL